MNDRRWRSWGTPDHGYSTGRGDYPIRHDMPVHRVDELINHSGKGPKNWQRSDERIHDDVCLMLTRHPEIDASEIEVTVKNGEVTLKGHVESRMHKRLAEDIADLSLGVHDVHNRLDVDESLFQRAQSAFAELIDPTGATAVSAAGRVIPSGNIHRNEPGTPPGT
jgi:hypothetical protein